MLKIKVKNLSPKTWDEFVSKADNSCFYDESAFLNYYKSKVQQVKKIGFFAERQLIAVLSGGVNSLNEFLAPFSASFGGFVVRENLKMAEMSGIFQSFISWAKREKMKKITIREKPMIYHQKPSELLFWGYNHFGFKVKTTDLTMYVETRKDFLENCTKTARNLMRRGAKEGFRFFESDTLDDVFSLIEEQSRKKGHGLSMSFKELTDLKKLYPSRIKFYGLHKKEALIAGAVVYFLNKKTALVMFWAYDKKWEKLSPTYYLIEQIVKECFKNEFSYLDFGNVTIAGEPYWGVIDFKEKFNPGVAAKTIFVKKL